MLWLESNADAVFADDDATLDEHLLASADDSRFFLPSCGKSWTRSLESSLAFFGGAPSWWPPAALTLIDRVDDLESVVPMSMMGLGGTSRSLDGWPLGKSARGSRRTKASGWMDGIMPHIGNRMTDTAFLGAFWVGWNEGARPEAVPRLQASEGTVPGAEERRRRTPGPPPCFSDTKLQIFFSSNFC